MKLGRNDPCPCGSGLKTKRCCGVGLARMRAHAQAEATAELFDLALHFPRARPDSASFDAWAENAPAEPSREAIAAGLAALGAGECERIVADFEQAHPEVWKSLVADSGDDSELAEGIVAAGAVVAGVLERLPLPESALALLERVPELPPVWMLVSVMSPGDLWSVVESGEAAAVLDELPEHIDEERWECELRSECARRLTPWHDARLDVLLERVRRRLPVAGYPDASRRLLDALSELDRRRRHELAAELLAGSLDRVYAAEPLAA